LEGEGKFISNDRSLIRFIKLKEQLKGGGEAQESLGRIVKLSRAMWREARSWLGSRVRGSSPSLGGHIAEPHKRAHLRALD
jgi:hypothetical protein